MVDSEQQSLTSWILIINSNLFVTKATDAIFALSKIMQFHFTSDLPSLQFFYLPSHSLDTRFYLQEYFFLGIGTQKFKNHSHTSLS